MALIPDLPAASGLSDTDLLVIDTGSATKKIPVGAFFNGVNYSSSVTLNENALNYAVVKTGKTVCITFQGESIARAEGQLLFTLPATCRPAIAQFVIGYLVGVPVLLQIQTNGRVIIFFALSYPAGRVYFSATFIAA